MPHVRRILFPVDFSEPCAKAAGHVAAWASQFNSAVTLLHAASIPVYPEIAYSASLYAALRKEAAEASTKAMDRFVAQHFTSCDVSPVVEYGEPGEVIVDYSREHKMDLIMMPTHGLGPFRRFLTGSVTGKVLHDALCPVWTSAHSERVPRARKPYRNILCGVDCNSEAVPLMRWAAWLGQRWQATVQAVHVIPALNETSQNRGEVELRRYFTKNAQEQFAVFKDQAGLEIDVLLRGGSIPARLAETARQQHADVLVVGRGQTRKALGRLRTNSLTIIRESPCPVLSI